MIVNVIIILCDPAWETLLCAQNTPVYILVDISLSEYVTEYLYVL